MIVTLILSARRCKTIDLQRYHATGERRRAASIDGSATRLGGLPDVRWHAQNDGVARALCEVTREELHRQDRRADAFVVGRRTFEDLRGFRSGVTYSRYVPA